MHQTLQSLVIARARRAQFFLNGALIADLNAPLALAAGANTITGSGAGTLSGVISDPTALPVEYLVVGGGAGSGGAVSGVTWNAGGGGGEVLVGSMSLPPGTYTISVGTGSVGINVGDPANGGDTILGALTARGGKAPRVATTGVGGASGNGNAGGARSGFEAGGGGGAGGAASLRVGGVGVTSAITGASATYGAGGPGQNAVGTTNAAANSGSGGGGASGNGGSGFEVLAYPATWPDLTITGATYTLDTTSRPGYKIYKFTAGAGTFVVPSLTSGSLTFSLDTSARLTLAAANTHSAADTITSGTVALANPSALGTTNGAAVNGGTLDLTALTYAQRDTILAASTNGGGNITPLQGERLAAAGGGGGARGAFNSYGVGGGGAGGLRIDTFELPAGSYAISVGVGGVGPASQGAGTGGTNTVFHNLTLTGGGGGGAPSSAGGQTAASGGSGGGGGGSSFSTSVNFGGAGISGQGSAGGTGCLNAGGGGGGAGGVGGSVSGTSSTPGAGGLGVSSSITGTAITYCSGGAGSAKATASTGLAGAANTGSGGGASTGNTGATGADGVIILAYRAAYGTGKATLTGVTSDSPTRAGWVVLRATSGTGHLVVA